jgi:hypothetical protein
MSAEDNSSISTEEALGFFTLRRGPNPYYPMPNLGHGDIGFHDVKHSRTREFYSPIADDDIRMLKLIPSEERKDEQTLHCEMFVHKFTAENQTPQYAAISYVCGDPKDRRTILCNGVERSIRASLYEALKRFQTQLQDTSILVWADELCINQEDIEEFSLQVSMMREIYERAFSVLIWLGEENQDTKRVWELLSHVRRHVESGHGAGLSGHFDRVETEARLSLNLNFTTYGIVERDPNISEVFYSLFRNPWFSRNWTFQEAVIAYRAMFVCGSYAISHPRLLNIAARLNVGEHPLARQSYEADFGNLSSLRKFRNIRNSPSSLSLLLGETRLRQAADPKDKVFSLIGLVRGVYSRELQADYSMTVEQVYAAVAAVCFLADRSLDPLDLTNPPYGNGIPSWVPDWRYPAAETWVYCKHTFRVDNRKEASIQIRDSGRSLLVSGFVVGTIRKISEHEEYPSKNSTTHWHTLSTHVPDWESIGHREAPGPSAITPLTPGKIGNHVLARAMRRAVTQPDNFTSRQWELSYEPDPRKIVDLCKVFTTMDGRYAGLCPEKAKEGDVVCVLFGSKVPYILRPFLSKSDEEDASPRQADYFTMVGGCYLHGYMKGELMTVKSQERFQQTVFTIR